MRVCVYVCVCCLISVCSVCVGLYIHSRLLIENVTVSVYVLEITYMYYEAILLMAGTGASYGREAETSRNKRKVCTCTCGVYYTTITLVDNLMNVPEVTHESILTRDKMTIFAVSYRL